MKIVRHDCVGHTELQLIKRPTNTCAAVNNFHFYAASSSSGIMSIPIVRFLGTDGETAELMYNRAVLEAHKICEAL